MYIESVWGLFVSKIDFSTLLIKFSYDLHVKILKIYKNERFLTFLSFLRMLNVCDSSINDEPKQSTPSSNISFDFNTPLKDLTAENDQINDTIKIKRNIFPVENDPTQKATKLLMESLMEQKRMHLNKKIEPKAAKIGRGKKTEIREVHESKQKCKKKENGKFG